MSDWQFWCLLLAPGVHLWIYEAYRRYRRRLYRHRASKVYRIEE